MKFRNTITIERSPAEVFAYLADFEKVPTWNYAIAETRKISDGPGAWECSADGEWFSGREHHSLMI